MARHHYSRPECEDEPGAVLRGLLDKLYGGDVLIVPNVGHLAHKWKDLRKIVRDINRKAAFLKPIYGERSEEGFKTTLRRAGAMRAKALGRYSRKGRPRCPRADEVAKLKADGMRPELIAAELGMSRASVFRALKAA